jgi:hypothetical protein
MIIVMETGNQAVNNILACSLCVKTVESVENQGYDDISPSATQSK